MDIKRLINFYFRSCKVIQISLFVCHLKYLNYLNEKNIYLIQSITFIVIMHSKKRCFAKINVCYYFFRNAILGVVFGYIVTFIHTYAARFSQKPSKEIKHDRLPPVFITSSKKRWQWIRKSKHWVAQDLMT